MKKGSFSPPRPNWQCNDCPHELFLEEMGELPEICPNCGSINVSNTQVPKSKSPSVFSKETDVEVHL